MKAPPTESEFIRDRCRWLIRKSSMNESRWEMTSLNCVHGHIQGLLSLADGEYPIISFFAGVGDWTLYTTHRMVAEVDRHRIEVARELYGSATFGNFKGDMDSPRVVTAQIRCGLDDFRFHYESGYASMAPIYYFIFWEKKWPVWRETFQLNHTHGIS